MLIKIACRGGASSRPSRAARIHLALRSAAELGAFEVRPIAGKMGLMPRVFLSYSHGSRDHEDRVLALVDRLRAEGVDAMLDRYEAAPPEGWPRWMARQMREACFVVVVCSARYRRRFEGDEKPEEGRGVRWEGEIITRTLYEDMGQGGRFVPMVFTPDDTAHIPGALRALSHYVLDGEAGYEQLYRRLTEQSAVERPELGTRVGPAQSCRWRVCRQGRLGAICLGAGRFTFHARLSA